MDNNETLETKKGISPLLIGGIVLLVIVLVVIIVSIFKGGTMSHVEKSNTESITPTQAAIQQSAKDRKEKENAVKTFEINASNFKYVPNVLTVNEGDMVKIIFKNTQGFHDFVIDEFGVRSKTIPANQTDEVQFIASKKGKFEFYCSVGNHRAMGMTGTLIVN